MPRPEQRTPQLRDRVLQAAVDTLTSAGVAGFTTRKVAEGAGTRRNPGRGRSLPGTGPGT